ncbi:UDP-N-acetylmuramoyl-tripeptide--D-alanyl-D-alanine ligase [Thermodesulfobacterium sp. TA1]|uniref:UDP-N-acetylmuramoyl-tripeptide--D-alanyl-D- alanine ligase n=1 Tax=Thermodesulfobacterium sp. TA1 TaxID=2234087 RepID=UPI0012328A3D|nr:UDP-N-acetylmuramoyl-tripeptide--D-alanyl-D-alanine ligase [Thermodesulfobacterium sp. TA1]QER41662.1 UDP-N-acetylmuramoyl-tripeptide--D-alanyl-D-alanine ligase [Thermodesulfobacterium sp. TA1]
MNIDNHFLTEEIVRAASGILLNGDMSSSFRGISTDTRVIKPGYLFWALKGKNFDGHDFWKEALDKGAKGLVISRFPSGFRLEELPKTLTVILVKDTLQALGDFAKFWRKKLNFVGVAITGSCGKTTTKELSFEILSKFFKTYKNLANYNNLIGVPLSILSIKEGTEVAVLELGTNVPGEIARLSEIVFPQVSVITCVYPAHLEGLSSLEGVLEEKVSLFKNTDPNGRLVYFYDQENLRERVKVFNQEKISFGFEEGADLRVQNLSIEGDRLKGEWIFKNQKQPFHLPDIGKHNLLNLLAAIGIGLSLNLEWEAILEKVEKEISFYQRAKSYKKGRFLVIDDTYNANPGSMRAALELLRDLSGYLKKVVILGDMLELGPESKKYHEEIGDLAKEVADQGYFIGRNAKFYACTFSPKPCEVFETTEQFLENLRFLKLKEMFTEDTAILVKGSRGLRLERVVERLLEELE